MGTYFDKGLEELGAERVYKMGDGNAEGNHTEDDFNQWKKYLWKDLFEHFSSQGGNPEEEKRSRANS